MEGSNSESCPGIKKFLRPKPEYVQCSNCASSVEIWSDEDSAECEICGKEVSRPENEVSCLDWCEFADKCRAIIESKKH